MFLCFMLLFLGFFQTPYYLPQSQHEEGPRILPPLLKVGLIPRRGTSKSPRNKNAKCRNKKAQDLWRARDWRYRETKSQKERKEYVREGEGERD